MQVQGPYACARMKKNHHTATMKLLCFYVPTEHCEAVKAAVFKAGGGRLGRYQHCAWQTLGQGQFMPLENSQPHTGKIGEESHVDEFKVDIACEDDRIEACIHAMRSAHPYETPAYHVLSVSNTAQP